MEAPDSLTMQTGMSPGRSSPRTNASVSRPAVPLPMAMASHRCARSSRRSASAASSALRSPVCGKTVSWASTAPCASRQTTLQPVRKPGSMASTRFCPRGAAKSSSRRLAAKTRIASSSAACLVSRRISVSSEAERSLFQPSWMARSTCSAAAVDPRRKRARRTGRASSSGSVTRRPSIPSASPRRMASRRCEGIDDTGSELSK